MTNGTQLKVLVPLKETGAPVVMTFATHAVDRYCERVRSTLTYPQACLQIQGMVSCAPVSSKRPDWARAKATLWLSLGDDVAFMVEPSEDSPDELRATTCLTRD